MRKATKAASMEIGRASLLAAAVLLLVLAAIKVGMAQDASKPKPLTPSSFSMLGTVDERFQSYNVEMVEVTGGRFWAPYKQPTSGPAAATDTHSAATPTGMNPSLYRYRAPIDLTNPRLRKLAAALAPAYIRVSGTWANTTYFQDTDVATPGTPPAGFGGVLTRAEWKGVIDFSKAVNAQIVTSFAISGGVRGSDGVWTSEQAEKWLRFTSEAGGSIALAEFFNEPTYAAMGGAPKGYDAAAYGRDFRVFSAFLRKSSPATRILGPGSVGEGGALGQTTAMPMLIKSNDLLTASGPGLDGFSYHFYGSVSQRCAMGIAAMGTTADNALSADWLTRTDKEEKFYEALRDRFEPGKPMWLTETGETACGGNPWASTFIDSFRYLHQLGGLAKLGVQAVMHNTLAASDYGLIDETTLNPRPNYWAALLWSKLMGAEVLEPGPPSGQNQYLYAHCLKHHPGGVAVLAINADRKTPQTLNLAAPSRRFTLTAKDLLDNTIELNGKELSVSGTGDLPEMEGVSIPAGGLQLPPASISFFAISEAGNPSCR